MRSRPTHALLFWLAALGMLLAVALGAGHSPASATVQLVGRGSDDTFHPETPPPGMVSKATAIQAAIHFAFGQSATHVPAGVQTRAYFGLYSDPIYSNRPVWIVRFWGPGLVLYGSGGPPPLPGTPYCAPPAAHEELVMIDGKTGKYLEATVGFVPTGLPTVVITPEPTATPCPTRPLHAMTPWTVAVGARDNVFVGGPGLNRYQIYSEVQKRSPAGRLLFSFSTHPPHQGDQPQIIRIGLDARGDVYVANAENLIQKFGPDGHLLWQRAPPGYRLRQTNGWWIIAVAPNGMAYVASIYPSPIYVLSPDGKLVGTRPGRWSALAVAPNGALYAANIRHGLVQSFSPSGRSLRSWHMGHNPGQAIIASIAAGRDGSVYVLDERVKVPAPYYEVVRYSMTGQVLHRIQIAQGPAPGQLDVPRDLAVAANGTVYIADAGNPRIVVVSGAGRYLGSWDL